jgi:hypothetical protein
VTYQFQLENFWIKRHKKVLEELLELTRTQYQHYQQDKAALEKRENGELSQDDDEDREGLKRRKRLRKLLMTSNCGMMKSRISVGNWKI